MDEVQHYEDNLNTNVSNSVNLDKFIKTAKAAQLAFNTKYHDGEFKDPATVVPKELAEYKPKKY